MTREQWMGAAMEGYTITTFAFVSERRAVPAGPRDAHGVAHGEQQLEPFREQLSLIHISEPTRPY